MIYRYCLSRFETLFKSIIGDSKNDDFSEGQTIRAYKKYIIFPVRVIFYHYCSVFLLV